MDILHRVTFNDDGLIPVIAQEADSNEVLMLAWMNEEALRLSLKTGEAVYYSRSRKKLWRKGEQSGHIQHIKGVYLDCDQDALLIKVRQQGGIACHTGRRSCFFQKLEHNRVTIISPVIKAPSTIYER